MKTHNKIFRENFIKEKIKTEFHLTKQELNEKREKIRKWIDDIKSKDIFNYNEEQLQKTFVDFVFRDLLGYTDRFQNCDTWNIETEMATDTDAKKPDATFGYFEKGNNLVTAVLELKDPKYANLDKKQNRKDDRRTPVEQAFSYAPKYKNGSCRWVLVSNFDEVRLYAANNQTEYEQFFISNFDDDYELQRFLYLMSKNHILDGNLSSLIDLNVKDEEKIEKEFYEKYKRIRSFIIQEILECNKSFSADVIINKTQKLLDRFLFVAFCEDKGFIPANIFKNLITSVNDFEDRQTKFNTLCSFINNGNKKLGINRFNGGLFKQDDVLDSLVVSDVCFERLIEIANYDFNTDIDENILGHIFEQSLSDLEEIKAEYSDVSFNKKDSKRKKDGVFYTPKGITRKIVETAIKEYIEKERSLLGNEPKKSSDLIYYLRSLRKRVMNIKIIDPACGSGAFLITAFDTLKNEINNINSQINSLKSGVNQEFFDGDGDDIYNSADDDEILKNCLYGVDLNAESVEITRLSLWLRTLSKDKPLTNLDNNIKIGNSLTSFDFRESFSDVFDCGGFDVVIGNPPYVRHESITDIKPILEEKFSTYLGTADLYCYFYELGLNILKKDGVLAYITSNKWLRINYGKNIRSLINQNFIVEIEDFENLKVFKDAGVDTAIIVLKKRNKKNENVKISLPYQNKIFFANQNDFNEASFLFLDNRLKSIKSKIDRLGTPLKEWDINIYRGILTGLNDAFIVDEIKYNEFIKFDRKNKEILKPLLRGRDIKRYSLDYKSLYLINAHNGYNDNDSIDIDDYPVIKKHLSSFEPKLSNRYDKGATPFNLRNCAYIDEFEREKIVYPEISNGANFTFDNGGYFLNNTSYLITGNKLKYLLAQLNSKLIENAFKYFYNKQNVADSLRYIQKSVHNIPIIMPTPEQENFLNILVDKILEIKEKIEKYQNILKIAKENNDYEKQFEYNELITKLNEQILDINYKIDRYIFDMYDLTQEEIEVITNA